MYKRLVTALITMTICSAAPSEALPLAKAASLKSAAAQLQLTEPVYYGCVRIMATIARITVRIIAPTTAITVRITAIHTIGHTIDPTIPPTGTIGRIRSMPTATGRFRGGFRDLTTRPQAARAAG